MFVSAVIPAAGQGRRMGGGESKLFLPLMGKPVVVHTVEAFERCNAITEIILVVPGEQICDFQGLFSDSNRFDKVKAFIPGGERRQDSVYRGICATSAACDIVVIHDGARPLIAQETIRDVVRQAARYGAAIAAVPVKDTMKLVRRRAPRSVEATFYRDLMWTAQTPQGFSRGLVLRAYEEGLACGFIGTDDSAFVERLGHDVRVVMGSYDNIKITTPEDLVVAEALMRRRSGNRLQESMAIRIGIGYDVHRLVEGRELFLGGLRIPFAKGLDGHSDADVLLHAIMDSLLGAAGAGDIGRLFPDDDPKYAGISSMLLLREVYGLLSAKGFKVGHIDAVLIAECPRVSPFVEAMRENISSVLNISKERVNIKATTQEGMGFVGRGEGMACHAVAILQGPGLS